MSVQELEIAVARLPREDFADFQVWFEEFAADARDARMEADARAGQLDHLIAQADANFSRRAAARPCEALYRALFLVSSPAASRGGARARREEGPDVVCFWIGQPSVYERILAGTPPILALNATMGILEDHS